MQICSYSIHNLIVLLYLIWTYLLYSWRALVHAGTFCGDLMVGTVWYHFLWCQLHLHACFIALTGNGFWIHYNNVKSCSYSWTSDTVKKDRLKLAIFVSVLSIVSCRWVLSTVCQWYPTILCWVFMYCISSSSHDRCYMWFFWEFCDRACRPRQYSRLEVEQRENWVFGVRTERLYLQQSRSRWQGWICLKLLLQRERRGFATRLRLIFSTIVQSRDHMASFPICNIAVLQHRWWWTDML